MDLRASVDEAILSDAEQPLTIGVDVGGTFTDMVASDGVSTWRAKAPTDPSDFGGGVLEALERVSAAVGESSTDVLRRVKRFGLGTTAVTNIIATRGGARVGLLTTANFEWHAVAARGRRISVDGFLEAPWSPLDPSCIVGIQERMTRDGSVLAPLDPDEVVAATRHLVEAKGIESLAISFLWSFRYPDHEDLAVSAVRRAFPNLAVFAGSDLHPAKREYERTILAIFNAACATALDGIEQLETSLRDMGLQCPMLVLQATGGTTTVPQARQHPLVLLGSGPAAGAVAAATVIKSTGLNDALCCDMGGTSFDVGVIAEGEPERRQRGEIHGHVLAQSAVDVESVGSGGGSVAWVDSRAVLRVGPRSARAMPGPACYGRGGLEATVTDALLVLGYIDATKFLGGAMPLHVDLAHAACQSLGEQLGLDAVEVAWGIRAIALADMTRATRSRLSAGGHDPRQVAVVSFGGSGSLFTPVIAADLGITTVIVPAVASVLSAFGAAAADVRRERFVSWDGLLADIDMAEVDATIKRLADDVTQDLANDGVPPDGRLTIFEADLRFARQAFDITVRLDSSKFDSDRVVAEFYEAYTRRYGQGAIKMSTPVELGAIRAIGVGKVTRAALQVDSRPQGSPPLPIATRDVYFHTDAATSTPVFGATDLRPGHVLVGPALIDDVDTTVVVPANAKASIDDRRTIVMTIEAPLTHGGHTT